MPCLLASEESTSVWDAAAHFVNGSDSTQRRLARKTREKWGQTLRRAKTWKDIERELNTN
jgi:hypothetical protein